MSFPPLILVVDDEPDIELLIRQRFRRQIKGGELKFDFAVNGEEALTKLNSSGREFDMVLTDINMPVMDGLTLLTRLKKQAGSFKAVVVSAYGDLENIRKAMNSGAFDFITKPIDFADLEVTIMKTLSEVRMIRQGIKAHEQLEFTLIAKERAELEKDKARQSEKFKQQFLANMSHEIRTPLNSIIGLTHLLLKSNLDDQQAKYLDTIKKSSENLLVIINDILDISKIEAGKMILEKTAFSLQSTFNNLYQIMLVRSAEKGLKLSMDIDDAIPKVLIGDPVRLSQILLNLLGNAIKFTEVGSVNLLVRLAELLPQRCVIDFKVVDTGIGIASDTIGVIFDSFSQASSNTNRKFGGTGLGLTISKQLIDLHGGSIDLVSEVGSGTTFSFTLPFGIGDEKDLEKPPLPTATDVSKLKGLRILLVEDNVFNQMVATDTLNDMIPEITIDIAENGAEGLEKASTGSYDLILMDIQMPVMDGFEAIRRIRTELPSPKNSIKIMAMTANVTKEEVDKCYDSGVDQYIAKPFDPNDLIFKIGKLVLK